MEVLQAIRQRRSINFFQLGESVPDKTLHELLEVANLAPSSFNLQPWHVVVVRNSERKKILRQCAMGQQKAEEAAAILIIIADPSAVEANMDRVLDSWTALGYMKPEMRPNYTAMIKGLYGEPDSLQRRLFAVKNASLYAMNLMIAARGLGLETHPMDGIDETCIKKEFNIPEDKLISMIIAVGSLRPETELLSRAFRRDVTEFTGFETY